MNENDERNFTGIFKRSLPLGVRYNTKDVKALGGGRSSLRKPGNYDTGKCSHCQIVKLLGVAKMTMNDVPATNNLFKSFKR